MKTKINTLLGAALSLLDVKTQILLIGAIAALSGLSSRAGTFVYDLKNDWSETANPNGRWTYGEGADPLPHVEWWQRVGGGWSSAQPGWAYSEDGADRLPFWYRSVGSETFGPDYGAGQICVHTTDDNGGVGNGPANVIWTSPLDGTIDISGAVWMAVGLGRGNHWSLSLNGTVLTDGAIYDGDPYSSATPFLLATGSGGASACENVAVKVGDLLKLELIKTTYYGSLVAVDLTVAAAATDNVTPIVHLAGDATAVVGSSFTASGSFEDPDADTWTATVDFGDGSGPQSLNLNADKTFTLSHTYSALGIYTVTVTVFDGEGGAGSHMLNVVVQSVATFLGPTPYLAFDDSLPGAGANISPFAGIAFDYFWLEDCEDGLLNTPGVNCDDYGFTSAGGKFTDSVDADDGVIDGSGQWGRSFGPPSAGDMTITFDPDVLGCLPTHVGIVWTDHGFYYGGAGYDYWFEFEAFDAFGVSLGINKPTAPLGDGGDKGGTAEDRFFGVICDGGISAIRVGGGPGSHDREFDHLQYGYLDTTPPEPTILAPASGYLAAVGEGVSFEGAIVDDDAAGTHTAEWIISSATLPATSIPGTVSGYSVSDTLQFAEAGVYSIKLVVTDARGASGEATTVLNDLPAYVVVYDPDGGFVTGGGWIASPWGAYFPGDEDFAEWRGFATFGFVSKYKHGANVPTGQTEFQYHAWHLGGNIPGGELNFQSSSYDWLVVAGARAQFKGVGTINGEGEYGFMVTAIDSQVPGGGEVDRFRIKIWDLGTEVIVYDNQAGADDDAELNDFNFVRGGNIVIHK